MERNVLHLHAVTAAGNAPVNARSLARKLNSPATLPGRMLRELRWLWRDVRDLHAELIRLTDKGRTKP